MAEAPDRTGRRAGAGSGPLKADRLRPRTGSSPCQWVSFPKKQKTLKCDLPHKRGAALAEGRGGPAALFLPDPEARGSSGGARGGGRVQTATPPEHHSYSEAGFSTGFLFILWLHVRVHISGCVSLLLCSLKGNAPRSISREPCEGLLFSSLSVCRSCWLGLQSPFLALHSLSMDLVLLGPVGSRVPLPSRELPAYTSVILLSVIQLSNKPS